MKQATQFFVTKIGIFGVISPGIPYCNGVRNIDRYFAMKYFVVGNNFWQANFGFYGRFKEKS
jgi:hypothetical protein